MSDSRRAQVNRARLRQASLKAVAASRFGAAVPSSRARQAPSGDVERRRESGGPVEERDRVVDTRPAEMDREREREREREAMRSVEQLADLANKNAELSMEVSELKKERAELKV
ncbi:hypothetical protein KIPB_012859 [Kipferlia bialata]|uniref:Uncharacterized protein n=1 Tax=Kipferlia bialata TaxID=797122 RepID=A0A391NRH4_9EUKA|nr:hypothetical protein KIPB_012859 [Kipferlia bialata]|eukprot:g12859.t1